MMNLEEKLIYHRKRKGLSQLDVAEALDVSRQAISRWETGQTKPTNENLKCLGKLYEVSLDYLLNDDAEPCEAEPKQSTPQRRETGKDDGRAKAPVAKWVALIVAAAILSSAVTAFAFVNSRSSNAGTPKSLKSLQHEPAPTEFYDEFYVGW